MNLLHRLALVTAALFATHTPFIHARTPANQKDAVRVLTANVRIATEDDGVNAWPNRRALLVKTVLAQHPDIVGFQEVSPAQGAYLASTLKDYDHRPDGNSAGLFAGMLDTVSGLNPIYFKHDRFTALAERHGMLRPDAPQQQITENAFYTLVVLHDKTGGGGDVIVLNTHLRHGLANAVASAGRVQEQLREALKEHPGARLIDTGDMNHDRTSPVNAALAGDAAHPETAMTDTFDYAGKQPQEKWGTYHNFTGRGYAWWPSDLIFAGPGWSHTPAEIIRDKDDAGHYPTDHFLVSTALTPVAVSAATAPASR